MASRYVTVAETVSVIVEPDGSGAASVLETRARVVPVDVALSLRASTV